MHSKILLAMVLLVISSSAFSQSYKILDHAAFYKKQAVKHIRIDRISYSGGVPADTSLYALVTLDSEGRPLTYVSHFAGGRVFMEENFFYDESGKLKEVVGHGKPTQGDSTSYALTFDTDQRLQSRVLTHADGSQRMEFFERCKDGYITLCTVQTKRGGAMYHDEVLKFDSKEAEDSRGGESNLTYLFDMEGMLLVKNRYTDRGELHEAFHFRYNESDFAEATD